MPAYAQCDDNDNDGDDSSKAEICRFTPSHPICAPNEDGECDEGFAMNEDGNCFPRGDCPDGYHRANDDETGACISEDDLRQCPDGSWGHVSDDCVGFGEEEPTPAPAIEEQPLDSNCGGVPCTATEKEDSTLDDEEEPELTDSEETVSEIEQRQQQTQTE